MVKKTRLIFHLSYNFNDGFKSVNFYIPKEKCFVQYRDLDYAVMTYLELLKEIEAQGENDTNAEQSNYYSRNLLEWKWKRRFQCHKKKKTVIFAGKTDVQSAFRILGLSCKCGNWLIMKAKDPVTNEWRYFVDKCLPLGQRFSDSLSFLIQFRLKVKWRITNYLDDLLFIAASLMKCNIMIQKFLDLCKEIGVPISTERLKGHLQ